MDKWRSSIKKQYNKGTYMVQPVGFLVLTEAILYEL